MVACYGVVDANPILVVGAMAVSPDLLPITAAAVGFVGRSLSLAARALLTLAVGMAVASACAAVFAFAQNHLGLLPSGFNLDETVLQSRDRVGVHDRVRHCRDAGVLIVVRQATLSDGVLDLLVYNAIWFAIPLTALTVCVVKPSVASRAVGVVDGWVKAHARAILLVVTIVVGVALVVQGALELSS